MIVEAAEPVAQLQLLLTERCNLRCSHCAVPEEESPAVFELTTDMWLGVLREAAGGGIRRFVLSGGEALLRPDCLEIARAALEIGAQQVVLLSNGLTITSRVVGPLGRLQRRWEQLHLHVSVDGSSPESHDAIRGAGTFRRTLAALQRLIEAGGRVDGIHTVLHRGNVEEIEDLRALVREIGAGTWTLFPLAALGRGRDLDALRLRQEEWEAVLIEVSRMQTPGMDVSLMGPTVGDEWTRSDLVPRMRRRYAGQAVIGPDGSVFTCPPLRGQELGRVGDPDQLEWRSVSYRIGRTLTTNCPTCKFRALCTGVEPGYLEAPDHPYHDPGSRAPVELISVRRKA